MTTYKGRAALLVSDGRQLGGEANLTKDPSGDWRGTLAFHDETLVPVLLNVRDGHVLIDGRPGAFVRPDTSDWTATAGGPFVIRIDGNGDAPF